MHENTLLITVAKDTLLEIGSDENPSPGPRILWDPIFTCCK